MTSPDTSVATSSEPTWGVDIDLILQGLDLAFTELHEIEFAPVPDYSKQGVRSVFDGLIQARALGTRAAHIHAAAIRAAAQAEAIFMEAKDATQKRMDEVVNAEVARLAGQSLSWEERASIFRWKALSAHMVQRKLEGKMVRVRALVESVRELARDAERSRSDLDSIAKVMQFSNAIGEL